MITNRARAGLSLLLALAGCKESSNPFFFDEVPQGLPGRPAHAAVLPPTCSAAAFDLDGSVWSVTGSAQSTASACTWPVGETRTLCDMEWTFVADARTDGLYEVHYEGTAYFMAQLCDAELYVDGVIATYLTSTGCAPGGTSTFGTFVGDGTPALAKLTFSEDPPASGATAAAAGTVRVHIGLGNCEWELALSLTRVDVAPLVRGTSAAPGTGSVLLLGDPALAAELARADLGLLLSGTQRERTWLPMQLLADASGTEVELPAGTWSAAIAPRPGTDEDAGEPIDVVDVHAGERTTLAWVLPAKR